MRIQFWSVGKNNEPYVDAGIKEFTKRISNYFPVEWVIIPSPKTAGSSRPDDLVKKEGEALHKMLSEGDFTVVLDERGKSFSSPQLASFIQAQANASCKQLVFIIGGAYGTDESILKKAGSIWSLSSLTFPHQLVRLILAEQVYRACTILRNEKYHHS